MQFGAETSKALCDPKKMPNQKLYQPTYFGTIQFLSLNVHNIHSLNTVYDDLRMM